MFGYQHLSLCVSILMACQLSFSTTLTLIMPVRQANDSREFPIMTLPAPQDMQPKKVDFDWDSDKQQLKDKLRNNQEKLTIADSSQRQTTTPPDKVKPIVRVLDLTDADNFVVQNIKKKYSLVTSRRYMDGSAGQNVIGTTIDKSGTQYYAHGETRPGYYDVFEFSPESLQHLIRCEEKAIRDRNLSPQTASVEKIVFGIVKDKNGIPDLGVKNIIVKQTE